MGEQLTLEGGDAAAKMALGQFDTPPELAARMVEMIGAGGWWGAPINGWLPDGARVLEPSAGEGVLVRALLAKYPRAIVDAVELDPARVERLRKLPLAASHLRIFEGDFLEHRVPYRYDLAIANPPFTAGAEREHIVRMMELSNRVIVQLPIRSLHGQARTRDVWSRIGREWWIWQEVRVSERVYPNASDDIILLDLQRREGSCRLSWWSR